MSDKANLALWESVKRTEPSAIKPITGKSYKGSSPNPYWLIWKATDTFGPCGIGWGFTIIDERIELGAEPCDRQSIARVRVWYNWNGTRGEVEHVGGTPFSGKRRSGELFSDEDAPKKSVTDALTKALSLIGFAGDIFGQRWDDSKYEQNESREEKTPDGRQRGSTAIESGKQQPPPSDSDWKELDTLIADTKTPEGDILKHIRRDKLRDMNRAEFDDVLSILKRKKAGAKRGDTRQQLEDSAGVAAQ